MIIDNQNFISNATIPLRLPSSTRSVSPPIKVPPKIPPTAQGMSPRVDFRSIPVAAPHIKFLYKGSMSSNSSSKSKFNAPAIIQYMSPAAANPLPILLVSFPTELKKLFIINFFGILNDLGIPKRRPFPIPRTNPKAYEVPTVNASLSPKSLSWNIYTAFYFC